MAVMKFAVSAVLFCVMAALIGRPSSAVQAAQIAATLAQTLIKMRAVDGGLYNVHISSTSERTVEGVRAVLRTDAQGLRFFLHQCTGRLCLGTYFDGQRLSAVNLNDTALPRSTDVQSYLRALRILGTLAFLSPDFTSGGGRILDGGYTEFEGCRCRRLIVSDPIATPFAIFVDPKTWLVAGARDVNGDASYEMHDYRRVGAFELPFDIDRNGEPLERYSTRAVLDTPLTPPYGIRVSVTAAGTAMALDPASVTPVGMCSIGGMPERCLIDTGNSGLSMSLELAEQLGLQPLGMFHVAGLGAYATEVVRAGPLQMGSARFADADYVVLPDIHRYGYDIVLGADVLTALPVTIDFAKHALYFGRIESSSTGISVPIAFENFVPVANVSLNGVAASLAVDTGDQSNINLSNAYFDRHPGLFQPTRSESVSGVGGQSIETLGRIPSVRIGGYATNSQQIGTTRTLKGTADGHLGAAFLAQFRLVLDYADERMDLLLPHPTATPSAAPGGSE